MDITTWGISIQRSHPVLTSHWNLGSHSSKCQNKTLLIWTAKQPVHIQNKSLWPKSPCSNWSPKDPTQKPCHRICVYLRIYSQTWHGRGPHTQAPPKWKLHWGFNPPTALAHLCEYRNKRGGQGKTEHQSGSSPPAVPLCKEVQLRWEEGK